MDRLRDFLAAQSKLGLTYPAVGATAAVPPGGYVVDHTRIKLGEGAGTFAAAKAALWRWEQFRLGWVEIEEVAHGLGTIQTVQTGEVIPWEQPSA